MPYYYQEEGSIIMPLIAGAILIGGVFVYSRYKKGGGTCNKICTGANHLDTASCTCVPNSCTKTCPSGQHVDSSCNCVPNTNGGGTTQGGQWYKANGPTTTISAGRQDGESNRWSKNVVGWSDGFEVMGYLTATGMQSGSHIGLKQAGPNHSGSCGYKQGGSCCCWWDGGLRRNGTSYLEIEYPHPNNKNEKLFGNMGRNIDAGVLGIRWLNQKEGNARRVMFWIDKSGKANAHKWTLMYNVLDTGQFMPTSYYSKIPNEIELEIRISDVPARNIKWSTGPVARKINPGASSAYTQAQYKTPITVQSFNARAQMRLPLQVPYPYNKRRNNRPFSIS